MDTQSQLMQQISITSSNSYQLTNLLSDSDSHINDIRRVDAQWIYVFDGLNCGYLLYMFSGKRYKRSWWRGSINSLNSGGWQHFNSTPSQRHCDSRNHRGRSDSNSTSAVAIPDSTSTMACRNGGMHCCYYLCYGLSWRDIVGHELPHIFNRVLISRGNSLSPCCCCGPLADLNSAPGGRLNDGGGGRHNSGSILSSRQVGYVHQSITRFHLGWWLQTDFCQYLWIPLLLGYMKSPDWSPKFHIEPIVSLQLVLMWRATQRIASGEYSSILRQNWDGNPCPHGVSSNDQYMIIEYNRSYTMLLWQGIQYCSRA